MTVIMGISLTAKSAVWALVDISDGTILADEVVMLDSADEIARAAAQSIQTFALQTERDIDGVRMTWTDDARAHGIRLRTKLRLFGFDTVETVSAEDARDGRNQTARHIAPHLVLAYGAARANLHADDGNALTRLAARVPIPAVAPAAAAVAAIAGVGAVAGVAIYALTGGFSSTTTPVTEAAAPAPIAPPQKPIPAPAPIVVPAAPPEAPAVAPAPAAVQEPEVRTTVEQTAEPTPVAGIDTEPQTDVVQRVHSAPQVDDTVAAAGITPTDSETISTLIGEPHLTGSQLAAGPVHAVVAPLPALPGVTPTTAAPVPPSGGPLSVFLGALP